jgi:hypothetical protein
MKTNKEILLNVDFIGNQDKPLTEKEQKEISNFIKNRKESLKPKLKGNRIKKNLKETV